MVKKPEIKGNNNTGNTTIVTKDLQGLAELLAQINGKENDESVIEEKKQTYTEFRNATYNIVSLMAYLIGVDENKFGNGDVLFLKNLFDKCSKDKAARIIRNLCRLRTAFEKNYGLIFSEFRLGMKNIGNLPELIPDDAVLELNDDGVRLYKSRPDVNEYIVAINIEINNRLNAVKTLFPEWIKWDYIKPLFIMPGGTKKENLKAIGEYYNSDRNRYPYQCWINWEAIAFGTTAKGNILFCDEKFVTMLYERNEDRFENLSLVRDVGNKTMRNLTDLLEYNRKCIIVVDCENSDAVKLAAALSSLPKSQSAKISKLLFFDSEYTTDQWKTLVDRTIKMAVNESGSLELEHIVVPRLNQNKSQVDMTLAVRTSREVFTNGVDAVILVSSDSDYWAMIQQLEGIRFLVMLERNKTGIAITDTLSQNEIPFCFIDDFCTSASYSIKTSTLLNRIQEEIDAIVKGNSEKPLNVRNILSDALRDSWITMTDKEREAFYNRYLLHPKITVDTDGQVNISVGNS